jgi:alanine racemase
VSRQSTGVSASAEEPIVGKIVIDSLVVDATDDEMVGVADQVNIVSRDSDKGGWLLIETEDAHNAVRVRPASEVRLEFEEPPSLDVLPSPDD